MDASKIRKWSRSCSLRRALPKWLRRTRHHASSDSPGASLRVTDDRGEVLVDVAFAKRKDYLLSVELLSGSVIVDLHRHYTLFAASGGMVTYHAEDHACRTYVKFGSCMQDKRKLHVLIQPAGSDELT